MSALRAFKVYAIRYATVVRRASENFIGGDPHERGMYMDYFVWVAIIESKTWCVLKVRFRAFLRPLCGNRNGGNGSTQPSSEIAASWLVRSLKH